MTCPHNLALLSARPVSLAPLPLGHPHVPRTACSLAQSCPRSDAGGRRPAPRPWWPVAGDVGWPVVTWGVPGTWPTDGPAPPLARTGSVSARARGVDPRGLSPGPPSQAGLHRCRGHWGQRETVAGSVHPEPHSLLRCPQVPPAPRCEPRQPLWPLTLQMCFHLRTLAREPIPRVGLRSEVLLQGLPTASAGRPRPFGFTLPAVPWAGVSIHGVPPARV